MTTEKNISDFFAARYDYLLTCADNSLKLIKRRDLANELVTDCYLYLIDNQDKLNDKINQGIDLEAYIVRWMVMQVKWRDTQFKKNWIKKDEKKTYLDDTTHANTDYTTMDILMVEDDDEENILQKELEHQNKINHIQTYVNELSFDKRLLYDIIFIKGYNTSGKLSQYLGLSRTPSYRLMKNLKDAIRDSYTSEDI
jgi:hypothetical protein